MTPTRAVQEGEIIPGEVPARRLARIWLIAALLIASAVGQLSGDAPIEEAWQLPVAGAALTLFLLLFTKSLDLVRPGAQAPSAPKDPAIASAKEPAENPAENPAEIPPENPAEKEPLP